MKQKLIGGAILAALLGLGLGAKKTYTEVEVKGCVKAVIYGVEQQFGEIPDDVKAKIITSVTNECRQIL